VREAELTDWSPAFTSEELSVGDIAELKGQLALLMTVRLTKDNVSPYRSAEPFYLRGKIYEEYKKEGGPRANRRQRTICIVSRPKNCSV